MSPTPMSQNVSSMAAKSAVKSVAKVPINGQRELYKIPIGAPPNVRLYSLKIAPHAIRVQQLLDTVNAIQALITAHTNSGPVRGLVHFDFTSAELWIEKKIAVMRYTRAKRALRAEEDAEANPDDLAAELAFRSATARVDQFNRHRISELGCTEVADWVHERFIFLQSRRGTVGSFIAPQTVLALEDACPAGTECAICHESHANPAECITTNCGHCFGTECFGKWMDATRLRNAAVTCPTCRTPTTEITEYSV